jgi:hypothetical protein
MLSALHDYAASKIEDAAVRALWNGIRRALRLPRSKAEIQSDDIDTLNRVVDSIIDVLGLKGALDSEPFTEGSPSDRATETYITDAVEAALESPYPAKHLLLGRLIAYRLRTVTESREDMFLRESLRIVRESNQQQLFAVGTLYLVHNPPESLMPIESLTEWWDAEYLPLLKRFVNGWNKEDLQYLERLGAVEIDRTADGNQLRLGSRPGPAIDSALTRRGFGPAEGPTAQERYRSEFAIYSSRLHSGTAATTAWPSLDFALYPYRLTTPGCRVALTIINALSNLTIETARNATAFPFPNGLRRKSP